MLRLATMLVASLLSTASCANEVRYEGNLAAFDEACPPCPLDWELETDGTEFGACVLYFELPQSAELEAYCHYLDDGYLGYSWPLDDDPEYTCPAEGELSDNGEGIGFCLWDVATPAGAVPHCEADWIGYAWSLEECPEP